MAYCHDTSNEFVVDRFCDVESVKIWGTGWEHFGGLFVSRMSFGMGEVLFTAVLRVNWRVSGDSCITVAINTDISGDRIAYLPWNLLLSYYVLWFQGSQ